MPLINPQTIRKAIKILVDKQDQCTGPAEVHAILVGDLLRFEQDQLMNATLHELLESVTVRDLLLILQDAQRS